MSADFFLVARSKAPSAPLPTNAVVVLRVELRMLRGARTSPTLSAVSMSNSNCISKASATIARRAPPISPTTCRASA
eukprot:708074-Pleurochrysis_carterae.AAC.1